MTSGASPRPPFPAPGPAQTQPHQAPQGIVRFLRSIEAAIVIFVVAGSFLFTGAAKAAMFWAVFAGVAWGLITLIARACSKMPWRGIGGAVLLASVASEVVDFARRGRRRG